VQDDDDPGRVAPQFPFDAGEEMLVP